MTKIIIIFDLVKILSLAVAASDVADRRLQSIGKSRGRREQLRERENV